jgi:hypothetical protein
MCVGHNPVKIDPGEYIVLLEHYVIEDLISSLNIYGMGAQAQQECLSCMNARLGQQLTSPLVRI